MYSLLLTTLLSMPIYPLNPTVQDTVATHVIHITAGAVGPNEVASAGPDFTLKNEFLIHHPVVVRAGIEYRFGSMSSKRFPHGHLQALTLATSVLYYRGTNRMTGYLGAGVVYVMSGLKMKTAVADSLFRAEDVTGIDLSNTLGYRFLLGLRYRNSFSLEISLTNTRPDFVKHSELNQFSSLDKSEPLKLNDVRVSLGYLFNLHRR